MHVVCQHSEGLKNDQGLTKLALITWRLKHKFPCSDNYYRLFSGVFRSRVVSFLSSCNKSLSRRNYNVLVCCVFSLRKRTETRVVYRINH